MPTRPACRVGAAMACVTVAALIAASSGWIADRPARSAESAEPSSPQQAARPPAIPARSTAVPAPSPAQSPQEKEIRAFDDLYEKDFNSASTKALAARFTEDAEVIEADGLAYEGRALIEERLAETLAAGPGRR